MLHALGLRDTQEAAYRWMIEVPSAAASELGAALGTSSRQAATVLRDLEAIGLVSRSASEHGRYVPVPPQVALHSLLVDRQTDLRRAESELSRLVLAYRDAATTRSRTDVVDVINGREAVSRRLAQLQRSARREVRTLVTPPTIAVSRADNQATEDEAVARGVRYRVVLARPVLDEPGMAHAVATSLVAGEQIRVAAEVPVKLMVADDRLALVSLVDRVGDGLVGALLVHPSELLDALCALFELTWRTAQPIEPHAHAGDELTEIERHVLSLLLAGLTDRSVAMQLGVSERSVQRHVRAVMDRVGAESRVQLGWRAAQLGWF